MIVYDQATHCPCIESQIKGWCCWVHANGSSLVDFSSMYLYINNNLTFYYLPKIKNLNSQSNVNVELWINLEPSIVVLLGLEIEVPTLYSALYLCRSAI